MLCMAGMARPCMARGVASRKTCIRLLPAASLGVVLLVAPHHQTLGVPCNCFACHDNAILLKRPFLCMAGTTRAPTGKAARLAATGRSRVLTGLPPALGTMLLAMAPALHPLAALATPVRSAC